MSKSKPAMYPEPDIPENGRSSEEERAFSLDERDIASRAYELWKARGCPDGSAEQDWLQAEREAQSKDTELAA